MIVYEIPSSRSHCIVLHARLKRNLGEADVLRGLKNCLEAALAYTRARVVNVLSTIQFISQEDNQSAESEQ
jgi:hypothetical protein